MAGHFYYDDTEITDKIELARVLTGGFAQSFNGGAIGSSGIAINDIAGTLNIVGFHRWKYTEDTATPTRVAGGYIGARKISKADVFEAPGVARVWDCDLMDLNVLAGLLVCRGSSAKRPAESDVTRISDYLLSDTGSGFYDSLNSAWLVFDNGGVHTAHPLGHDEDDLRGKYPEEVLQSITWDRRVTCLYWDDTAAAGEEPSLWWAPPEDVRGAITQKLSNNPAHINGTTVFAAFEGQAVARDPAGITSGAYLTTKAGTIYRTSAATSAAFISRDRVYQTDLIGKAATAEALAVEMLAFGAAELDVVTCSVEVAAADVNIFREGYSVQAEFTHLPGYSTYQTLTIYNRIVRRPEGMTARYVLDLTLSASAPKGTGGTGGSPGDFPHPPPTSPSILQSSEGLSNRTFASTPTAGDTLLYIGGRRHDAFVATGLLTYTIGPDGEAVEPTYDDRCAVFHRLADGSESTTLVSGDQNGRGVWLEFAGEWDVDAHAEATNNLGGGPSTGAPTAGAITVAPNSLVFAVAVMGEGGGWDAGSGSIHFTPPAGFTELSDGGVFDGHPSTWVGYLYTAAGGSFSAAPTCTNASIAWATQIVSFVGSASGNAPLSGQRFGPVSPVETPDGVTTTFTLPAGYEFADYSLEVFVNRLDQTLAVTSFDGAARTFTLAFAPKVGWLIEVYAQGR